MMAEFIKGLELCGAFYTEVVRPLLESEFPGLRYSTALIGPGSDVLGFDTEQSTDHFWGPRLWLFLSREDHPALDQPLREMLSRKLPYRFRQYSTNHEPIPGEKGTWRRDIDSGPVKHLIFIRTVEDTFLELAGIDLDRPFTLIDWLTTPQQILLSLTAGRVYHDGLGTLNPIREKLAFYPHDVWCYLMAGSWRRIAQEEPFMGRNGQVGDELGSSILAARLVQDIMGLCFLMERRYAPYPKWFGSGFARLNCASKLSPLLEAVMHGTDWHMREKSLCEAYSLLAEMHNALHLTEPLSTEVSLFHERPFQVIHGDRFADALFKTITDPAVRKLPRHLGGIDHWVHNTDVRSNPDQFSRLGSVYKTN
jgi:hypothetical protein